MPFKESNIEYEYWENLAIFVFATALQLFDTLAGLFQIFVIRILFANLLNLETLNSLAVLYFVGKGSRSLGGRFLWSPFQFIGSNS
ncbi:uncharacterized protein V1513DRAFT_454213 [Lipomyces chichibuensis]|uniref:uncharacterized protein n=1 Tax=Lipomyces chichibuensis TaxID=1546026 RepID=UPI003343C4F5